MQKELAHKLEIAYMWRIGRWMFSYKVCNWIVTVSYFGCSHRGPNNITEWTDLVLLGIKTGFSVCVCLQSIDG